MRRLTRTLLSPTRPAVALVAVLALVLAACSGGEAAVDDGGPGEPTPTAAPDTDAPDDPAADDGAGGTDDGDGGDGDHGDEDDDHLDDGDHGDEDGHAHAHDDEDEDDAALAERRAEVAGRGAEVMPFDLELTMHRFEPTPDGLTLWVSADDPDDDAQIAQIRDHLEEQGVRFAAGDLDDPAAIHGEDMPGLAELRAGASDLDVEVEHLPNGARLMLTATDPELVDALHRWGDAQTHDHGDHADDGHDHDHA